MTPFLFVAKASCAEVRAQLYIAADVGYLDGPQFRHLMDLAEEVGRILGGLISKIERDQAAIRVKKPGS